MKLRDYLKAHKITETAFAARVGLHQSSVNRLCAGVILPDWKTVAAIKEATDGAVTADDFMPEPAPSSEPEEKVA